MLLTVREDDVTHHNHKHRQTDRQRERHVFKVGLWVLGEVLEQAQSPYSNMALWRQRS